MANADKVVQEDFERLKKAMAPGQRLVAGQQVAEAQEVAAKAIDEAKAAKDCRDVRIRAAAASALVAIQALPKKPSPLIKAIMDSIKLEEGQELQYRSAATIARLVKLLTISGRRGPADKVVSNLVKFSCMEVAETPEFPAHASKRNVILSMQKEEDRVDHPDAAKFAREAKAARITRRGTKEALDILSRSFGADILTVLPSLRSSMQDPLVRAFSGDLPEEAKNPESTFGQEIVDAMSVIRTMAPTFDPAIHPFVLEMMVLVIKALHSELSVFRYMAAKCLATICSVITIEGMTALVEKVLPSISNPVDLNYRQGAIEVIYHLIAVMGDGILPYVIFLIVPVLGRMSDSDHDIRLIATTSFATLVKLVPLEAGIPDPPGLSKELLKGRDRERTFISPAARPKEGRALRHPRRHQGGAAALPAGGRQLAALSQQVPPARHSLRRHGPGQDAADTLHCRQRPSPARRGVCQDRRSRRAAAPDTHRLPALAVGPLAAGDQDLRLVPQRHDVRRASG